MLGVEHPSREPALRYVVRAGITDVEREVGQLAVPVDQQIAPDRDGLVRMFQLGVSLAFGGPEVEIAAGLEQGGRCPAQLLAVQGRDLVGDQDSGQAVDDRVICCEEDGDRPRLVQWFESDERVGGPDQGRGELVEEILQMLEDLTRLRTPFLLDLPDVDGSLRGGHPGHLTGGLVDRCARPHGFVSVDPVQHRPPESVLVQGTGNLERRAEPRLASAARAAQAGTQVRLVDVGRRARVGLPPGGFGSVGVWADTGNPFGERARGNRVVRQLGELHIGSNQPSSDAFGGLFGQRATMPTTEVYRRRRVSIKTKARRCRPRGQRRCLLIRASIADIPRRRRGLTASLNPRAE
ncbi:unannotated protein [freshwater metagenome]|uniref:Unannotated protein n=1 Tax=freshwater metagenome TaxID=449393 RepID=A0A6J7GJV6_9ZZZZ